MSFAAKLDEIGKPAWIVLVVLGFMAWWPLGFAILAFAIGSGRMGCWKSSRCGPLAQGGPGARVHRLVERAALERQSRLR